jgi:hypothetical protein
VDRKTIVLGLLAFCLIIGGLIFFFINHPTSQKTGLSIPEAKKEVTPSKTFIEYEDPSGFSFSYPDNVSLSNRASEDIDQVSDPDAYAQLQLFSKDKSGSLNLKIADTKFKTLEEWLKANNIPETLTPEEKKLGDLKAFEVKTKDRLMLAALDQGVLFTIESPLIEEAFWNEVYNKVVSDFSFAPPQIADKQASGVTLGEAVVFEGEEVVE